ncbi:MAG: hypothetical protein OXF89_18130 [Rhodospirillaceae bacterium]|nr:hypothetical protein [Rhodospirillaceae bacterium]MCY4066070.1 hypothetical protein [Rhodospirillaceae bacterium]
MRFDPASQDVGNIVFFEHVNLTVPDQETATDFYVAGLGLTRDPYMMVGTDNMWINAGRQQFHLPKGNPQRFRGIIGLVLPNLEALEARLRRVAARLDGTQFSWRRENGRIALTCPWGNRFRAHPAGGDSAGPPGIPYLDMPVPEGAAAGIAQFYRTVMGAPAAVDGDRARVTVGPGQHFLFRESGAPAAEYDGHHVAVYAADFSGPYRALAERGLVTAEDNASQYRFVNIAAPGAETPLFAIEHEVRSLHHPLYARPLVNRNGA